MRKIFDFAETTMLTIYCFILIGVMLFEHMIYVGGVRINEIFLCNDSRAWMGNFDRLA